MRIWINRARSAKSHLVHMLKNNPDGTHVTVHATYKNHDNPTMQVADVADTEPDRDASDEEYGAWAVEYAARNGIDVLVPSERLGLFARIHDSLEAAGTQVLTQISPEMSQVCDSKTATYALAANVGLEVPPHHLIDDPMTASVRFREAVWDLESKGYTATVKPDTGFAAPGFRAITQERPGPDEVFSSVRRSVFLEDYAQVLAQLRRKGEDIPPLIVAPLMEGPEISIDVLRSPYGEFVTSVARVKSGARLRTFTNSPAALHIARTMAEALDIRLLCNVQTRMLNGRPVLLEVNARTSDGLYQSAVTGVNLPWEAVRLAMGKPVRPLCPDLLKRMYSVEGIVEAR